MPAIFISIMKIFSFICYIVYFTLPLVSISGISSCALDIPDKAYEYLAPPVITALYQDPDDMEKIIVEFTGYNDEYYFDGYNVYISTTSMNRNNIQSYKPVQVDGDNYASAVPSFPMSPDDYNPDITRTISLYHYWVVNEGNYEPYPFASGTAYYVLLCSHHRYNGVVPESVSNQPDPVIFE